VTKYDVTLIPGEDGFIVAECPSLPGCVSQGKTRDEALQNIKEAIGGILEVRHQMKSPTPPPDVWTFGR
jgi:predicted RNase H-like HicB family nuclease